MTTLNIEKSTRERINNVRRDCRTYDDILNRVMDGHTKFESFLPIWASTIDMFNEILSETENPKERIEQLLDSKKTFLNTCSKCGNMWETHVPVETCTICRNHDLKGDKDLGTPFYW